MVCIGAIALKLRYWIEDISALKLLNYFSLCVTETSIPHNMLHSHPRALFARWVEYVQIKLHIKKLLDCLEKKRFENFAVWFQKL